MWWGWMHSWLQNMQSLEITLRFLRLKTLNFITTRCFFFFLLSQSHFHQKCVGLVPFVNTSAHAITVKQDSVYYFVANTRWSYNSHKLKRVFCESFHCCTKTQRFVIILISHSGFGCVNLKIRKKGPKKCLKFKILQV